MELNYEYNDLAIILAWPDATIRGDEKWMMFFKKIGIVKNLNFKVGHTGIILVERASGTLRYYDFGRYISPRGYGRARSVQSDPRLKMETIAKIDKDNRIQNLHDIVEELENMKETTQGEGRLFFSIVDRLSFVKARQYAGELVLKGSMPYGAVAKGNNNCSRFITRLLIRASQKYHLLHGIRYPETIKSSPMSNVVNVRPDRCIYRYDLHNGLQTIRMTRFQSLMFLIKQLADNVFTTKANQLPDDAVIGSMEARGRPSILPSDAQWLGGVGEGAWYSIRPNGRIGHFIVKRYTEKGEMEYETVHMTNDAFDANKPFTVAYDSHLLFTSVTQNNKTIVLYNAGTEETVDGEPQFINQQSHVKLG